MFDKIKDALARIDGHKEKAQESIVVNLAAAVANTVNTLQISGLKDDKNIGTLEEALRAFTNMQAWADDDPAQARDFKALNTLLRICESMVALAQVKKLQEDVHADPSKALLSMIATFTHANKLLAECKSSGPEAWIQVDENLVTVKAFLATCRDNEAEPLQLQLAADLEFVNIQLKNFPEGLAWCGDFKGATWEEFELFAAESLKNFDKDTLAVFSSKLSGLCVQCRDLQKIEQQFLCTDEPPFVVLRNARPVIEAAFIFKIEGICMDLLNKHGSSPLTLKRHVNANFQEAKSELTSVIEGYTFEIKKINKIIATRVAEKSSFAKKKAPAGGSGVA